MRSRLLAIVVSTIGILAGTAGQDAAAQITVRVSSEAPLNHFSDVAIKSWAKRVEELTTGAVKIQVFPAGQLFTDREAVER